MIFAAVGTTGFNDLVKAVDDLSLTLSDEVIIQIGTGDYVPRHCRYFRFVPSLDPYYERASVVVSHGGSGTVSEVLSRGLPLIAVEDPLQPDRHQREILSVLENSGHLIWCRDLRNLLGMIEAAKKGLRPYVPPECRIHLIISEFLKTLS